MVRPCFVIIDQEHFGNISTRKLVIESAKLNVITAYSCAEAIETLRKFPAADGVVFNSEVHDIAAPEAIAAMKQINPKVPVVLIGYPSTGPGHQADYYVDSFEPELLLRVLQSIEPEKTSQLAQHEQKLREQ